MIAVDTNVLVYAASVGPFNARARRLLTELAGGSAAWGVPWPCVYEFLRLVTHVRAPARLGSAAAWSFIEALFGSPQARPFAETAAHGEVLKRVLAESGATGNLVFDAHIAALCVEHGVTELYTGDKDFHRFRGFKLTNPFA